MIPELLDRIRGLPDQPGIYLFKDQRGKALYVGKAKSLRKRLVHYLRVDGDVRLSAMIDEARDLEFLATGSEADALLLENAWIKKRQPRYNIRLRDDKTYPYLKLTLGDDYPRLAFTRRVADDGAEYFGPYLPAGLARRGIKLVQKLFQVRVCRIEIDGKLPRPCLYYDMKRCLGPCVNGLTSGEEYRAAVDQARWFLGGKSRQLAADLRRRMLAAADREQFEQAARLRDTLAEVGAVADRQQLAGSGAEEADVYGVHVASDDAAVTVLMLRDGHILDRRELFFEAVGAVPAARLLSELLPQIYDRTTAIPREIHLPVEVEGEEALVQWLSTRRGTRVYLRHPSRGQKASRLELAMRNARLAHRRRFRTARVDPGAATLQRLLGLAEPPRRIEGFDVSTFHGDQTVASLVVWLEGRMTKGEYRSFNVRGLDRADDFASIRQAVDRRYRRRLAEVGEMPDLILIDGGRGQLNAALEALAGLGVEETPIVGLAKREEEIYVPERPEPLLLPRRDAGLRVLQTIRDEAHRFAVSRHRRRRSAKTLRSRFDGLAGVGEQRRKTLVRRFGSYRGVEGADLGELQEVLGAKLGESVFRQLRESTAPGVIPG